MHRVRCPQGRYQLLLCALFALSFALVAKVVTAEPAGEPVFRNHVLYAPAHFGNSYEVMGVCEMRQLIAEAKHWGFNRYADWYDTVDCSDPFAKYGHTHRQLAEALWQRKVENFVSAQELGLKCDLVITPNHVFIDQCTAPRMAKSGGRVFGQLICPSVPEARAIILRNYENMFADLARAGVQLSAICPCPYDYGGCLCDKCQPWILTFAQLCREIHAICKKYHPDAKMHMIGWWWKPEEHTQLADWVDANAPGWVERIYMHIPYGKTEVSTVRLPKGCARAAFVHVGYADQASPRDVYGHLGPVMASSRLPKTITGLKHQGVDAVMAYSEGVFDDVNRALLAGIGSGQYSDAQQVLEAYAQRYFDNTSPLSRTDYPIVDRSPSPRKDAPTASKMDPRTRSAWAQWLKQWGVPYQVDTVRALQQWADLAHRVPCDNWRLRQWHFKAEMLDLNRQIMALDQWTPERLALADRFWQVREQLHRQVWGLGPVRHVLDVQFNSLPWYSDWKKQTAK